MLHRTACLISLHMKWHTQNTKKTLNHFVGWHIETECLALCKAICDVCDAIVCVDVYNIDILTFNVINNQHSTSEPIYSNICYEYKHNKLPLSPGWTARTSAWRAAARVRRWRTSRVVSPSPLTCRRRPTTSLTSWWRRTTAALSWAAPLMYVG